MEVWLNNTYERLFKDDSGAMKLNRGMIHEYLRMTLDYSFLGEVKITMYDYISDIIADFKRYDPSNKNARTPAAHHLFKVRDDQKKLPETLAQFFHTFTARALFSTKRARPDIHTAVAFLTTRLLCPDDENWTSLVRLIRYLRATPTLPLILSANSTNIVKWWVDGSFGVHPDTRIQKGCTASLGKGSFISTSIKQKLNTRSSTET